MPSGQLRLIEVEPQPQGQSEPSTEVGIPRSPRSATLRADGLDLGTLDVFDPMATCRSPEEFGSGPWSLTYWEPYIRVAPRSA